MTFQTLSKSQIENISTDEISEFKRRIQTSSFHVGLSHNTLGVLQGFIDNLDEALVHYDRAIAMFEEARMPYWEIRSLCGRGEIYRRLASDFKALDDKKSYYEYINKAQLDLEQSLYLSEKYQIHEERATVNRRLGRLFHDLSVDANRKEDKKLAKEYLHKSQEFFEKGLEYALRNADVLEELENLAEMTFLSDDAIVILETESFQNQQAYYIERFRKAIASHRKDKLRLYQFPVFENLLKLEMGALAFSKGDYRIALAQYLDGYKGLGSFPGYGVTRFKLHFSHIIGQIDKLPDQEKQHWCKRFVEVWESTTMPGTKKTLAQELLPDLVEWCNRTLRQINAE